MFSAVLFVAIAALFCLVAVLAIAGMGLLALSGPDAIERDGLSRGRPAPSWSLPDACGCPRQSPPGSALQLIMFADHSLEAFPGVLAGLRALRDEAIEIVVLLPGRAPAAATRQTAAHLSRLGLDGVAVVAGSPELYARYNVRVLPFAIFVDKDGVVRASSLVNADWQLAKLRQVAELPLPDRALGDRRRSRPALGRV